MPAMSASTANILLCESDPPSRQAAAAALGRSFEVSCACSIDEMAARLREWVPDAIICELTEKSLAEMTAWSDSAPEAAVIFTYAGQDTLVAWALRRGAAGCLPRPVDTAALGVLVGRAIEQRRLRQEAAKAADRIDRELAAARRIQEAMLPAAESRIGGVSISARWRPCAELGGDLIDYADAGQRGAALLVADVSGHGTPAAMLTALVKAAFRSTVVEGYAPLAVVGSVARNTELFGTDRFLTLFAARIDARSRTVEYVNAGHPPGQLFHRGQVIQELHPTGPLVSHALPDEAWQLARAELPANSGILLYTDGVLDASGEAGRFGAQRLVETINRHRGGGKTLLDGILAAVDSFTGDRGIDDDVALMTASVGLPGLG
jgi:phosphoserine phosphatase RsbU/P